MSIFVILLLATLAVHMPHCRVNQVHLSLDGDAGEFNSMSHSGTELSIHNAGPDCVLIALPMVELRDARNRVIPAIRQSPLGMHPGPVMPPVRLAAGQRAATELHWVSGPVFPHSRSVRAARVTGKIRTGTLSVPLTATLYGEVAQPTTFEQTPLHAIEGMAAG